MKNLFLTKTRWLVTIMLFLSFGIGQMWATDYTDREYAFTTNTAPTGWETNGDFNSSSYYMFDAGEYAQTTDITAVIPSGQVLSSDMAVKIACGRFGSWGNTNATKKLTATVQLLDGSGNVLSSNSANFQGLTAGIPYKSAITVTKPTSPENIAKIKVILSDFNSTTTGCARFGGVKLTYSTAASASCSTPPSVGAATNGSVTVSSASVTCASITKGDCNIDAYGIVYGTSTEPTGNAQQKGTNASSNVSSFDMSLNGLNPNTKYYARAYATVGGNTYYGDEINFTTKKITASSSNTTYGTVSRSGLTITGSLKSGGQYASPAYSISGSTPANATTVSQSGNTFTVTSTSTTDITVTINFEAVPADHFIDEVQGTVVADQTSAYSDNDVAIADKSVALSGTCEEQHYHFVGWITKAKHDSGGAITDSDIQSFSSKTPNNSTYYAVWAKAGAASSTTYKRVTSLSELYDGVSIVIVDAHYEKALTTTLGSTTGPTETDGKISNPASTIKWTLEASSTNWKLKTGSSYLGVATLPTSGSKSKDISLTSTNSIWKIGINTATDYGTNVFYFQNYNNDAGLEYYNTDSKWVAYYISKSNISSTKYYTERLYIPAYTDYISECCVAPGTALSITGANTVAMDATLSPGTSGGNGGTVTWSVTSGTGTATINPSTGVLTPGSVGTVTIHAHQDANEKCAQDAEKEITILAATVPVSGVTVDPTSKAIVVGETFTITPTVSPSNATDKSVSWTSTASGKASVSNGTVTGVAKGTANITCTTTDGGFTATTAVTVYNLTVLAQDEDGTDISGVSGITASHTGKALSAGVGSTKYVFKTWKYATGGQGGLDDIPSATSTSTTLTGTPTGDVTVIAEFYKPIVVHYWNNGVDVYDEEVARGTNVTPTYSGVSSGGTGNYGPCDATHIYYYGWSKTDIGSTPDDEATVGETYSSVTADVHYYAVWTDVDAEDYSSNYTGGTQVEGCAAYTLTIGEVSDIAAMKIGRTSGNYNGSYTFTIPQGTTTLTLRARGFGSTDVGSIEFFDAGPSITPTDITPTAYGGFGGNGTSFTLDPEDDLLTYTITGCTSQSYDITVSTSSSNRIVIYDINTSTGGGGGGGGGGSGDAEYITRCCTELATIGGAEKSKTYNSVTLQWNDIANVSSWTVTCKKKSDGTSAGTPSAITTVSTKKNITFTGLDQYTDYVFTISATAASGYCNTDDVVEIKTPCVAPSSLSISSSSNKWDFCAGESMTLTVNGTNVSASATYQWQKHNGSSWVDIDGANSASYTVASMAASNAGQYRCTITNPGSCAATTEGAWVRLWQLHLGDDDIDFTYVSGTTGSNSTVHLNSDTHYEFKLKDNNGGWFGLNDKTITATISAFALNGSGANVNVTSGLEGNYTFTINYSDKNNPTIAVTYPVGNQPSGRSIWFDKSVVTGWNSEGTSDLYYRIGKSTNHTNNTKTGGTAWTLVPGTDKFYTTKTMAYDGFEAWAISNNAAWCDNSDDTHSIYGNATDSYKITKAIDFQKYVVGASGVTIVPTSSHNTDGNGCNYWYVSKTDGMLTHTATITPPTNGTITIANAAQSLEETTTTSNLPHRTILTVTATPAPGYQLSSLTVNGEAFTSGNEHILSADATIAAMFTAKTITITWDGNGGNTPSPTESSYTYNGSTVSLATVTHATKLFVGWFTDPSDGTQITEIGTTNKPTDDVTYYAHWVDGNTVYFHPGVGSVTPTSVTQTSLGGAVDIPTPTIDCDGWSFAGWNIGSELAETTTNPEASLQAAGSAAYVPASTTVHMYAVWKKNFGGGTGTITNTYDWEATNSSWSTNSISNVRTYTEYKHGGSYSGTTSANEAYVYFLTKMATPDSLVFYYTKASNNSSSSNLWKVQTSTNGSSWTDRASTLGTNSLTKGTYVHYCYDLTSLSDVYVRLLFVTSAPTAGNLDDVSIYYEGTIPDSYKWTSSADDYGCVSPNQVKTPVITPAGGSFTGSQSITITCATDGATIRYTTDGTDPSSSVGTFYEGAFTLSCSGTVKAIAYKATMDDSNIASETYTIKTPNPTFSPDGEYFGAAQSVSISDALAGTTIYYEYTTDGSEPSDPTESSTAYSSTIPVAVGQVVRIKAIGINACCSNSDIVSKTIRVGSTYTLVTDANDLNDGDKIVIIANSSGKNALSNYNADSDFRQSTNDFVWVNDATKTEAIICPPIAGQAVYVQEITLQGSPGAWVFNVGDSKALNQPSDANKLTTKAIPVGGAEDGQKWTISISTGLATITNVAFTNRILDYTSSFKGYTSATEGRDGVKIYSIPTTDPLIKVEGTFSAFTCCTSAASEAQSFYVSGKNLDGNMVISGPSGYEFSLDGSSYSTTLTLVPSTKTIARQQVYIRLASGLAVGSSYTGNVTVAVEANSLSKTITIASGIVTASDTYIDRMHGAATQYGCGSYSAPTLVDFEGEGTDCQENYAIFRGWVAADQINLDGTLKAGATVVAGGTSKTASGTTYYSIWEALVE